MSNLHLVTGYAGQAHVTAADDGSFNTAIFGNGEYVLDIGSKFAATVVSNNKITIADGDLLMQGRHVRLNEGTTVDLTINNGTQGKYRNDLIVARYTKNTASGVEEVNLVVIQGTAADSNPADPAYTSGDIINDHALLNDMPLYRVPLNGLTVGTPVALFEEATVGGDSLLNLLHPVGSIFTSVNSTSPASLFGGTWERIKDRFLLAAGDSYAAGEMDGKAEHTLTAANMPTAVKFASIGTGASSYNSASDGYTIQRGYNENWKTITADFTINGAEDEPVPTMPPYLVVYVWKRTA